LRAQADKLAQPAGTAEPVSAKTLPAQEATEVERKESTLAPWLLIGGGGAVLAGGVVVALLGRSDISDVENAKDGTRWSAVKGKEDSGPRKVMIGSVLGGLGVAAAATGLVWLLMSDRHAGEAKTQVGFGLEGVQVSGRF